MELSSYIKIRHRIVVSPVLDLLKVPAHMFTLVVRPIPLLALLRVEGEDVDIGETHKVHTKNLNTVV